ncbi:MAG: hypothetical protein KGI49_00185 [Patescibacteria group bacterium]|nr:hypothetical protein [Patescibacteria group bacterium]
MNPVSQSSLMSHHANLLIGGASIHAEIISILEKKQKIKTRGNPDFFDREYQTLTIDDARELKALSGTRPVTDVSKNDGDGKKIFVLRMDGITVEAQNALLKLLEEPPEYARFFLILPSAHLLLPTVRSRLSLMDTSSYSGAAPSNRSAGAENARLIGSTKLVKSAYDVEGFLRAAPAKRFDMIKSLMDDISKEKKTKQDAIDLLDSIEAAIHAKGVKGNVKALEAIELARKYTNDRAPSLKMLLEYVAMTV